MENYELVDQTVSVLDAANPRHPLESEPEHPPVTEGQAEATGEASVGM